MCLCERLCRCVCVSNCLCVRVYVCICLLCFGGGLAQYLFASASIMPYVWPESGATVSGRRSRARSATWPKQNLFKLRPGIKIARLS